MRSRIRANKAMFRFRHRVSITYFIFLYVYKKNKTQNVVLKLWINHTNNAFRKILVYIYSTCSRINSEIPRLRRLVRLVFRKRNTLYISLLTIYLIFLL